VSRDDAAARDGQLVSCAAEQSKCCPICTATFDPGSDLTFTSLGRWQCLRGGADGSNGCCATCGCGTEYRCSSGGRRVATCLGDGAHCPFAAQRGDGAHYPSQKWYRFNRPKLPGQNFRERFFGRKFEFFFRRLKNIQKGD
jgi:hypothetical protein